MNDSGDSPETLFAIKDCALIALSTGIKAQSLRELRDRLETIPAGSIYYHFWGGRLRPRFVDPEYNNDFAAWSRHALHDRVMAERLAMVDPTEFEGIEGLRQELLEIIDDRLSATEMVPWAKRDQQFTFIDHQIVVFQSDRLIREPAELASAVSEMSSGSIYYHFIDARRRTPAKVDDFRAWLLGFGDLHTDLVEQIAMLDPYFQSLTELQVRLSLLLKNYFARGPER